MDYERNDEMWWRWAETDHRAYIELSDLQEKEDANELGKRSRFLRW